MKRFLLFICLIIITYVSNGQQFLASNHISGTGTAEVENFITDEVQNTYICGAFNGQLIHDKKTIVSKGSTDIFLTKYNDDQEEEWFVVIGGGGNEQGSNVTFSPDGNIVIVGSYSEGCVLGTTLGNSISLPTPGESSGRNVFLAKYNSETGELIWGKVILAGIGNQYAYGLCVDQIGNIWVGGGTAGNAFFPNTENTLTAGMGYLAKFKKDGTYQWSVTLAPVSSGNAYVNSIISYSDNLVYSGYTKYETTFTDKQGITTHKIGPNVDNNSYDYFFIGSIDSTGNYNWLKNSTSTRTATAAYLSIDKDNTLYLTGLYDNADFSYDGQPLNLPHPNNDKHSIYLMTLDNRTGDRLGAYSNGSIGTDYVYGLMVKNNLLYLSGEIGAPVKLPNNRVLPAGMFVAAYNINVDKTLSNIDVLEGVKANNTKGIVFSPRSFKLTGSFSTSTITIGDSIFTNPNTSKDVYMAKACPIIGINPTITDVTGCAATGNDGKIVLDVVGDAGPYTYEWSKTGKGVLKNITGNTASQLDTGRYAALVIYNEGYCSKSIHMTVKAPQSLGVQSIGVTNATCGITDSNGSITVNAYNPSGKTLQYKAEGTVPPATTPSIIFDWQDGNVFDDDQIVAARYTVSVRFKDEAEENQCPVSQATLVSDIDPDTYTLDAENTVPYTCSLDNGSERIGVVTAKTSDNRNFDWYAMVDASTGATVQATPTGFTAASEYVFDNVVPGNYEVKGGTFTPHCMKISDPLEVLSPTSVVILSAKPVDILCRGSETGKIIVTATGGKLNPNSTLKYSITNGTRTYNNTNGKFENIVSGTYTLTVTDDTPCSAILEGIEVKDIHDGFMLDLVSKQDACSDGSNGKVRVVVKELDSEGNIKEGALSSTYTYILALKDGTGGLPSNASGIFNNVMPNVVYRATAIEQGLAKCTAAYDEDIQIGELLPIKVNSVTSTATLCFDTSTGSIIVSGITGGTSDYKVTVNNSTQEGTPATEFTFDNLPHGDYQVKVVDNNSCTINDIPKTVANTPDIIFTAPEVKDVTCAGELEGQITVHVDGGTTPYQYELLENGDVFRGPQASKVFGFLPGGFYKVRITDANNCIAVSNEIEVYEPDGYTYTYTSNNVSCHGGNNGNIEVNISTAGVETYFLIHEDGTIDNNGTSPLFTGLSAGIYKVKIYVDGSCGQLTDAIEITEPEQLEIVSATSTQATCKTPADGTITVTVTGGTAPYKFAIGNNTPTEQINPYTFTGLSAGKYDIKVTDAKNCPQVTQTDVEVVQTPAPAITNVQTQPAGCSPGNDGAITVTATSSAGSLQYRLDGTATRDYQPGNVFEGLGLGTYTVTVKDGNDCTAVSNSIEVTQTPAPSATAELTKYVSCVTSDGDGVITATATGTEPFRYKLSDNSTVPSGYQASNVFDGLREGTYSIVVEDGNGCTTESNTIEMTQARIEVDATKEDLKCYDVRTGKVIALPTAQGVVTRYSLLLNGDTIKRQTTPEFTGLAAGKYSVTVRDEYRCTADSKEIEVTQPTLLKAAVSTTKASKADASDGSITIDASGGVPSYKYGFTNGTLSEGNNPYTMSNLAPGNYSVQVEDANGCKTPGVEVTVEFQTGIDDMEANSLKLYPNPSDGRFVIQWNSKKDMLVNIEIFGVSGKLIYKTKVQTGVGGVRTTIDISNQPKGTYILHVPELEIKQKLVVQ